MPRYSTARTRLRLKTPSARTLRQDPIINEDYLLQGRFPGNRLSVCMGRGAKLACTRRLWSALWRRPWERISVNIAFFLLYIPNLSVAARGLAITTTSCSPHIEHGSHSRELTRCAGTRLELRLCRAGATTCAVRQLVRLTICRRASALHPRSVFIAFLGPLANRCFHVM